MSPSGESFSFTPFNCISNYNSWHFKAYEQFNCTGSLSRLRQLCCKGPSFHLEIKTFYLFMLSLTSS